MKAGDVLSVWFSLGAIFLSVIVILTRQEELER